MFGIPKLTQVQAAIRQVLGGRRAVAAQAQISGGALNYAAQSSVQSERDKAQEHRRQQLLGHAHGPHVNAPEAPHLQPHEDEGRPKGRVRFLPDKRGKKRSHDPSHHDDEDDEFDDGPKKPPVVALGQGPLLKR